MSAGRIVRGAIHGLGELCITLGLVLLLFVAWQLWWTDIAAGQTQRQLTHQLEQQWQAPTPPHPWWPSSDRSTAPRRPPGGC